MLTNNRALIIIAAVVATLLQAIIAPHIAIGYGMPNFMAVVCLIAAVVQPQVFRYVLPFVMGLMYDLISGGPVGAMAFSLTAMSAFVSFFFARANNDTLFMGIAAVLLGLLLTDLVYGMFILLFGYATNLLEAFVFRILPCLVYDAVITVILFPIAARFLGNNAPLRSEITQLH